MPLNFTMHMYTHNDITNSGPVYKKVVAKYSLTFVKIAEIWILRVPEFISNT